MSNKLENIQNVKMLNDAFKELSYKDLDQNIKMTQVMKFYDMRLENPLMPKKDICKNIGISLPTLNNYLKEVNMGGFVRNRTNKKKNNKDNNTNINTKSNKNKVKGGNIDHNYLNEAMNIVNKA